uniref:C-type lectin domain-containing protein n=1 Tax=Esox lucius TaxID=8010 RepID=A0A6Q2Y0L3_ESOLU
MLKFTVLFLALSGLNAVPLRDDVVSPPRGRLQDSKVLILPLSVPVEERSQGTEPSSRFLMDLKTGLVKEHISEMERRVGHMYPSSVDKFRLGTKNSQNTLVDIGSRHIIDHVGEMVRSVRLTPQEPVDVPVPLPFQRRVGGWIRTDALYQSAPLVERRQGTEPSRRFLVDLNTGLVKEHISEMDRRVAPEYSPSSVDEFRQGTENSRKTLVDIRTGRIINPIGEMERSVRLTPEDERLFRPELENLSAPLAERRQGTETSRRFLVDLNTGLVKEHISEMDRRVVENLSAPLAERRQGTETSRRFLVDLNTGLVKEHISEMDRRVVPEYSPSSVDEFRQGTENSRKTLVDIRNGRIINPIGEMERSVRLTPEDERLFRPEVENLSAPLAERRQGTETSRRFLVDLNTGLVKEHISEMDRRVVPEHSLSSMDEIRQGTENSQKTLVDISRGHILHPVGEMERSMRLTPEDPRLMREEADTHSETECVGEIIDGRCYQFNPKPMTFSEAESSCRVLSQHGHLASVTNSDLHSRLVSMVKKATKSPVLTWLGGIVKDKQSQWADGSTWGYSDWMPGHPDTQTDKQTCLEMFRIDESWWTAVDCELKRASICSFPMVA